MRASIIVPTYNRASFLADTISSVLKQTIDDIEIVIVDDGSTDNTRGVVSQFDDSRIKYIYQINQGRSAARNTGAMMATAEIIGFLDSDDCYFPDTVEKHLLTLADLRIGASIGGYEIVDFRGRHITEHMPWLNAMGLELEDWFRDCYSMPGAMFVRKNWFEKIGGFQKDYEIAEDWGLFLQLSLAGCKMDWTKSLVCKYKVHSENSIHSIDQHLSGAMRAMEAVFSDDRLKPEQRALKEQTMSLLFVNFCRRYFWVNDMEKLELNFSRAISYNPNLSLDKKLDLIELLIRPPEHFVESNKNLRKQLQKLCDLKVITISPQEINVCYARMFMRNFYQLAKLKASFLTLLPKFLMAIYWDWRWAAKKDVWKILLKSVLGWLH